MNYLVKDLVNLDIIIEPHLSSNLFFEQIRVLRKVCQGILIHHQAFQIYFTSVLMLPLIVL